MCGRVLGWMLCTSLAWGMVAPGWLSAAGVVDLPRSGQTGCWDTDGVPRACAGTGERHGPMQKERKRPPRLRGDG